MRGAPDDGKDRRLRSQERNILQFADPITYMRVITITLNLLLYNSQLQNTLRWCEPLLRCCRAVFDVPFPEQRRQVRTGDVGKQAGCLLLMISGNRRSHRQPIQPSITVPIGFRCQAAATINRR